MPRNMPHKMTLKLDGAIAEKTIVGLFLGGKPVDEYILHNQLSLARYRDGENLRST